MYRDARLWHDALRLAEDYLPGKVQEIHAELASGGATVFGMLKLAFGMLTLVPCHVLCPGTLLM